MTAKCKGLQAQMQGKKSPFEFTVSISVISFYFIYFIPQDFWQRSSNSVNQLLRSCKGQTTTKGTPGIPCPAVSISVAFVKLSQRNKNLLLILFALYIINRYFQSHVTLVQKKNLFWQQGLFQLLAKEPFTGSKIVSCQLKRKTVVPPCNTQTFH